MGQHLAAKQYAPGDILAGHHVAWKGALRRVTSVAEDGTVTFDNGDMWTFRPGDQYEVSEHEDPHQGAGSQPVQ